MASPHMSAVQYGGTHPYNPPDWAKDLKLVPKNYVKLSMSPTPIHKWSPPGVPDGFEVGIKREDLSGCTLSGNKVRKLEFLFADALEQGCDMVITFGGFDSNHARATAMAAREVGLEPYVFILDFDNSVREPKDVSCQGNALLMRLVGTHFIVYPLRDDMSFDDQIDEIHQQMEKFAEKKRSEGHKVYTIPKGGSNTLGAWAWMDVFSEMMGQGLHDNFDDIFVAGGSVGTACGLAIANYLTGSKLKIHCVSLYWTDPAGLYAHLKECLRDIGLTGRVRPEELVNPVMDYIGLGLSQSTDAELDAIVEVMSSTGIVMDPMFTVKSYLGMVGEMSKNPSVFKGRRVLYIHTGGVYILFGRMDTVVQRRPECNRMTLSSDLCP